MLRQQVALLEADNMQLRLKLQVGHESNSEVKSAYITAKLDQLVKDNAGEAEIQKTVTELQERFSDYGRDRRSGIEFHITQLRRCLVPTQTTRAILWLMSLAPKFLDKATGELLPNNEPSELYSLWTDLMRETAPTKEQQRLMVAYTMASDAGADPFEQIQGVTSSCNDVLDRLTSIIGNKNDTLDQEMATLQTVLSATQIAKFILWIDQNPACMQMLEALWPHLANDGKPMPKGADEEDDFTPSSKFFVGSSAHRAAAAEAVEEAEGNSEDDSDNED